MSIRGWIARRLGITEATHDELVELAAMLADYSNLHLELTHKVIILQERVAALEAEAGAIHGPYEGEAYQ